MKNTAITKSRCIKWNFLFTLKCHALLMNTIVFGSCLGISQAGQSPANLSSRSRLSNANRSAVIADKSAVAADKSAVAADKSAVNVGSQGSGTASSIPSTQEYILKTIFIK